MRMRTARIFLLLAAMLIVRVGLAWCQDVEVTLEADQTVITLQDTLTVQVTVSGARGGDPKLPESPLFQVVGTSSGQNITLINGQLSRQKTVSYTLMPIKTGRARLGPATVRVGRKSYQSNTVEVEVVHSEKLVPQAKDVPGADVGDEIFLKAEATPTDPYLGGQVTVSLYLYTRVNISGLNFSQMPDFKDFWAEELLSPNRPQFQDTEINGVPYKVALIRRVALFPLKEGPTSIDSFGMTAEIRSQQAKTRRSRSNWPFDVFDEDPFGMFGQLIQKELRSLPIAIEVRPLPTEEQPASFQDVVGRFKMKVSIDKTRVAVGDPVTMKMVITGEGNFKTLVAPKANIPESFNTYSETSDQEIKTTAEKVGGTKTYSMILVPRQQGTFDIGPVTLDYFDPVDRVYKQLRAESLSVEVSGEGTVAAAPGSLPVVQREVTAQGTDIRYIRADAKHLKEVKSAYYLHPAFLGLILIWLPLLVALFFVQRYRKAALADVEKLRSRRAGRVSRTRLKQAKALLDGEQDHFYNELTSAILGFIADKTGQTASGIVVSKLIADLGTAGASEELCRTLRELFAEADAVRYGGRQTDGAARKATLDKAYRALDELDQRKLLGKVGKG